MTGNIRLSNPGVGSGLPTDVGIRAYRYSFIRNGSIVSSISDDQYDSDIFARDAEFNMSNNYRLLAGDQLTVEIDLDAVVSTDPVTPLLISTVASFGMQLLSI